jgi:hypothetical protein
MTLWHRFNMELDLQSLYGLCAQLYRYSLAETTQLPLPPSPRTWAHIDRRHLFVVRTFDSLDVDHAGDVAELELGEHPVEDLEGLVDLLRVVRRRGQALQHSPTYM